MLFESEPSSVVLRHYQEEMRDNALKNIFQLKHRGTLCVAPTGTGKCHARGTRVIMFDGPSKAVEDVVDGDLLMGPDSKPRKVISTTHGMGRLYKVIPAKGEPYVVNGEHILSLKFTNGVNEDSGRRNVYASGAVINISVEDYLEKSKWFKHCAKGYRVGVDFPEKPVKIDPYFLGVWLGDGSSSWAEVTTADSEIVDFLRGFAEKYGLRFVKKTKPDNLASTYALSGLSGNYGDRKDRNEVLELLRDINVINNKHIPNAYLRNSREVRLQVLAGIVDTDGSLSGECGYDLVFKNERLAQNVTWLARSLGFAAYMKPCKKTCVNNGVVGSYFRISISGDVSEIPVRIPRKKAGRRWQSKDVLLTGIRDIVECGYGDFYGFDIDGDHLYLMDDFTVTHNSLTMGCTALAASHHGGVLILAHFKGLVRGNRKAVQRLGRDCYVFSGEEKDVIWSDVRKNGAIVSGSVQAILNHLPKIDPSTFKLILIDEGHHAILDSAYDKIRKHFGCPVVLYSATPDRQDGEPLVSDKAMCESVAFNGQTRQFIKDGWILNPEIVFEKSVKLDYSVLGSGSVTEKQAQAAWENTKAHYAVITPFLQKCGDMSAIGFAPSVKLAKLWNDLVNDVRPGKSEYVASYKPGDYTDAKLDFDKDLRRIIEAKFDDFSLQYLWNQGVYLEGADLVAAQVCMLGIVTDSRSKYTQAVGRVLRPCNRDDGKSILTGYERATPAERLALIAASKKKCAYVFDYGGSSGPNKLVHPVDLFGYNHELPEEVRERVVKRMEEIADKGGGDAINLEEIVLEQEESYKQFVVRDRAIRKSLAVEVEVMTRDIDPFGPPEVAGHQRYTLRKVNPPAPKAVEQIRKLTKELGKNYSPDFYRGLTNAKAFAVLAGLRKQADAKRATQPCESWILNKLKSLGNYTTPKTKLDGIRLLQKIEREQS